MLVRLKPRVARPRRLARDREYLVVGLDDGHFRVVNEGGEPVLYERALFDIVEPSLPCGWVRQEHPDGEYFLDPPETSGVGFYEDLHDRDDQAVEVFNHVWERLVRWQSDRT